MTSEISYNKGILKHSFMVAVKACLVPSFISFILLFVASILANPLLSVPVGLRDYVFVLLGMPPAIITGIIIFSSAVLALMAFKFIYEKNAVNVFFSLGLTRKQLYATRYLAGIMMSVLPIILVLLITYIGNIIIFGSSTELTTAVSYLLLGYITVSVLSFTISSLAYILTGTLAEGGLLALYSLSGITLLMLGLNYLMKLFLFGNIYGEFERIGEELVHATAAINPLLFFLKDAFTYDALSIDRATGTHEALPAINVTTVISWLIVAVLLAILAQKLFEDRKAEITQKAGTNNLACFICTLIPTFFFFALIVSVTDPLVNRGASLLLATIGGVIIYVLHAQFFAHYPFRSNVLKLPAVLGICLLAIVILSTGGLGFANRIPAAEDIENVHITYVGYPHSQPYLEPDGTPPTEANWFEEFRPQYTSESDIRKVLDIHQAIIEYGKRPVNMETTVHSPEDYTIESEIIIIYTLKNGRELIRYYQATSLGNLLEMLSLDETDYMKPRIANVYQRLQSIDSDIYITDIFGADSFNYEHDEVTRSRLLTTLNADNANLTPEQRYFPTKPALGVIDFSGYKVFITEDYTETISFLEEENLLKHFEFEGEIDYLTIERYFINPFDYHHYFQANSTNYNPNNPRRITNEQEQTEILNNIRTNYFAVATGGYIVGVHIEDEAPVYMFLPEEDAPEFVKNL
ncbi:MATE family efflux transporter [Dethiobacter alkaliphilus]|uniref:Uncharacterized protein n=1 Tax=Dethiobacter alkaliphilus AHT 1 TaxID=555088 RepID=C0GE96_DETAL|nr:ABC transporter permease [Dethiobacter alkaliphilus]EEG78390.1 hypothetical protein DealDRAFT_0805 [Dethiobacter alkaliphilus AHT 1]